MKFSILMVKLISILEPAAEAHDFELVTIEVTGTEKHPIVTVYLDNEDGIDLDKLAAANVWIDELIEDGNIMSDSYTLEVSSPGVNRPLRKREDFTRFTGEDATIKERTGADSSTTHKGVIKGLEENDVLLETKKEIIAIPINHIISARLRGRVDFKHQEGK